MKNTILFTAIAVLMGLTIGVLVSTAGGGVNAKQPSGGNLGNHHQEMEFTIFIGESKSLPMPTVDRSIHVVYSLSNVFDADTGNAEEPATGTWAFFYDSANDLGPEIQDSESLATGCNARARVHIANGELFFETVNGSGPTCREDTPAKLHVSLWY